MTQYELHNKMKFLSERATDQKKFVAWKQNDVKSIIVYVLVSRNGHFELITEDKVWFNGKQIGMKVDELLCFNLDLTISLP